jgi:hypothetical protein
MSDGRKKRKRIATPLLKRPVGRLPPMPERIPDDPENIVPRILMRTPPPEEFRTNGSGED